MKNLNKFYRTRVLLAFLISTVMLYGQAKIVEKKTIVIDPGHGGIDSGAIGINGIKEKNVVLNIALKMARINESILDSTLEIYLTRYSDTLISLKDRSNLSKALQADVFISLHCNQADTPKAKGTEVYVSNFNGNNMRKSILIGYEIEKALVDQIGLESRGVKFANFQVLRETVDDCPAVLVEIGFLSNMDESNYVSDDKNLKVVALLLLDKMIKSKL